MIGCETAGWQSVHLQWGLFGFDELLTDSLLLQAIKPATVRSPADLELDGLAGCEYSQK